MASLKFAISSIFLYDLKLFVLDLLASSGEIVLWIDFITNQKIISLWASICQGVPYVFSYPYLVTIQLLQRCNFFLLLVHLDMLVLVAEFFFHLS